VHCVSRLVTIWLSGNNQMEAYERESVATFRAGNADLESIADLHA